MTDVEVNGKLVSSQNNGIARALDGMPDEPKGATQEMKQVATAIIEGLMNQRCISGWFGDRTAAFKQDEVNHQLKYFIKYQETKRHPLHINYVISHTHNLQKHVAPQVLEKYANFMGYQLKWGWWETSLDGKEYPRFHIRSVHYIGTPGVPYEDVLTYKKDVKEVINGIIDGYGRQQCADQDYWLTTIDEYQKTKIINTPLGSIASIAHNLQKIVSPDILNQFANSLGYELRWQPVEHVPDEYPRFCFKSANIIQNGN